MKSFSDVPEWVLNKVEFERRKRRVLLRIGQCYHRAWECCRTMPGLVLGLTDTGLWRCVNDAVIAHVEKEFEPDKQAGEVETETRKGLFLLHHGITSFRFNKVNDDGQPARNQTRQTNEIYSQQGWLFAPKTEDGSITIVAGHICDPLMEAPPEVLFQFLIGKTPAWASPLSIGVASDIGDDEATGGVIAFPKSPQPLQPSELRSKKPKKQVRPGDAAAGA